MARTIRIDEEVYRKLQENAKPFEPTWRAMRRALGLELPPESASLADFEESLKQEAET